MLSQQESGCRCNMLQLSVHFLETRDVSSDSDALSWSTSFGCFHVRLVVKRGGFVLLLFSVIFCHILPI